NKDKRRRKSDNSVKNTAKRPYLEINTPRRLTGFPSGRLKSILYSISLLMPDKYSLKYQFCRPTIQISRYEWANSYVSLSLH
ncbi:hypothetical protein, partial [Klebsiella variicola]|uniref:hypothetical protein n=1 Tax=Klebsiella variicola TaxID=244366 RepID=UPI0019542091